MHLEDKEKKSDPVPVVQKSEVISPDVFMDPRLPYDIQRVVAALLSTLVAKDIISKEEAKRIMKSGESYLH